MTSASPCSRQRRSRWCPESGKEEDLPYTLHCPGQQLPSAPPLCGASAGTSAAKLGDIKPSEVTQAHPGAEPQPPVSPLSGTRLGSVMASKGQNHLCSQQSEPKLLSFRRLQEWDSSLPAQGRAGSPGLPKTWLCWYLLRSIQREDGLSQLQRKLLRDWVGYGEPTTHSLLGI